MMGNFRDELQTYAGFDFAAFFAGVRDGALGFRLG